MFFSNKIGTLEQNKPGVVEKMNWTAAIESSAFQIPINLA